MATSPASSGRTWTLVPFALALPALGYFAGSFLDGAGVIQHGLGFLISCVSMFILPWFVAFWCVTRFRLSGTIWLLAVGAAMALQWVILLGFSPPAPTSEMMGIAFQMRRSVPVDEIRDCAIRLRRANREGTLRFRKDVPDTKYSPWKDVQAVDESELPESLRGRFASVLVRTVPGTKLEQVIFTVDSRNGIFCDDRKYVRERSVCSIADGVHAYRFMRM